MHQLTLFPPRGDANPEDLLCDRRLSMRSGSRSPRATSESEYVSLADLTGSPPRSVAARAARLVGLSSRGDEKAGGESGDGLAPLTAAGASRVGRVQDALLGFIAALCLSLICWACSQRYSGQLCETTASVPSHGSTNATTGAEQQHHCRVVKSVSRRFASRGAPDVAFTGHAFEGGWPLPHTLLHVLVPVAVLLCVVAMRLHTSTVHHSLAWLWLGLVELSVIIIDIIALRRWQGPICRQLQAALASSVTPQTNARWSGECETPLYEAFVVVEMLLFAALTLLVLLEPVIVRLWCGVGGRCDEIQTSAAQEETVGMLQREDVVSPGEAYRRL